MADLLKSFHDFVEREQLFTKTDKLLLACSGGLDSTVLAHLLHAEGYDFAIAHMNFQLRGEASDGDAAFVEELARTLDAKFHCKAVDVKGQAEPGESTQMTARRLRYSYFSKLMDDYPFKNLLTAHHQDDNLETALINMIRGTGLAGIRGMLPKYHSLTRPLLMFSRAYILLHAQENGITWREDASNSSDAYLRNRIRHHLTPLLAKEYGLDAKHWNRNAEHLSSDHRMMHYGLKSLKKKYVRTNYSLQEVLRDGWLKADLPLFKDLVFHVARNYHFTVDQVRQILSFEGQRSLDSISSRVFVTPECITFSPIKREEEPLRPEAIHKLPASHRGFGHHAIRLELLPRPSSLKEPDVQYLAPPTLPLHLRPRQKGDRFQPLGLGGKTKKVKDYMIDEKIPVWLRDQIYLLTNDQDEIMAIPGCCISEKFKVLPEHETVLRISWK
ncbi:MAG: tRNA(Ile)-lysidine synthase [Neolewinella sp.]|jgi:tRNA(Ile)-lysidine synthase